MPYDERIRDPLLRSQLADEGLTDEVVSKIFLEVLRHFFLSVNNFTTKTMRERDPAMLWSDEESETAVRIVRAEDWEPANMGQTPEIVVRSQGSTWKSNQVGGMIDSPEDDTVENPTRISDFVFNRTVIWAISKSSSEVKNIAWELATFFSAFSGPMQKEYGFCNLRPAGVGGLVRIRERKGYWGSPVVIASQWELIQDLIEQQPRLAEIEVQQTTSEVDYSGA